MCVDTDTYKKLSLTHPISSKGSRTICKFNVIVRVSLYALRKLVIVMATEGGGIGGVDPVKFQESPWPAGWGEVEKHHLHVQE